MVTTGRNGKQKTIYLTTEAETDLAALAARWGLSQSATIAKALHKAAGRKK